MKYIRNITCYYEYVYNLFTKLTSHFPLTAFLELPDNT